MRDANGTAAGVESRGHYGPSAKQRAAVLGIVRRLLDDLAPERQPSRSAPRPTAVERHRTPRGCILQAATCAVSVSWFPAAVNEGALGELQVVVWRGVVARPGSANRATGQAVPLWEAVLRPEEVAPDAWVWRGADDQALESAALAALCRELLDGQLPEGHPAGVA